MEKKEDFDKIQDHINEIIDVTKSDDKEFQQAGADYINRKQEIQKREKFRLANYLVNNYIDDLFSVAIDAGSTQQLIIEQMMDTKRFLSILTNNMTAFRQNSTLKVDVSANEFILSGGKYVALFDALLGNETVNSFDLFHPNVAIIGVSGLIASDGFYCHGNDEVNVKKLLFQKKAAKILIPADYSKLGRSDSYGFGKTSEFQNRSGSECIVVTTAPIAPNNKGVDEKVFKKLKSEYEIRMNIYNEEKQKLINSGIKVDEAK